MRGLYASHTSRAGLKKEPSSRRSVRGGFSAPLRHQSALQYSYRLLAYRGRSEKELRERLKQKGFDEQAIDTVIGSLISGGFLDDRKLASSLTRYATESKHYGITGTRKFLRERGIPRDLIDTTVKDIDETEIARKIVEKKMRTMPGCPPEKAARRLYAFLYRKGYSPETIKRALEDFVCREDLQ